MNTSLLQLEKCSQAELDNLFSKGTSKEFPQGDADGVVLLQPMHVKLLGQLVWKGKNFDVKNKKLTNRILGLHLINGKLAKAKSLFDGKPVLVIDYRKTSRIAGNVIDELREVGKGVFLGRAYRDGVFFASFALKEKKFQSKR